MSYGKVFISYSKEDFTKAQLIAEEVRQSGLDCWFAPVDLNPGESLASIAEQIESAQSSVVLLSRTSLNSAWVRKEIGIAVSRELASDIKPLLVIPVLLERVAPPAILADKVAVDCTGPNWKTGLQELVSVLKGEKVSPSTRLARFQSYIRGLVALPVRTCETLRDLDVFRAQRMFPPQGGGGAAWWRDYGWSLARTLQRRKVIEETLRDVGASSRYASRILEEFDAGRYLKPVSANDDDDETAAIVREDWATLFRVRSTIAESLRAVEISEEEFARILAAYDAGDVLPIIALPERVEMTTWARHCDDQMIALAGELWRTRTAVDETWIIRFVKKHAESLSEHESEWLAHQLVARAKEAGLLMQSADEVALELGPMAFVAGRIVSDFELSESLKSDRE